VVDVSRYPYFSHDELLELLLEPITSQSSVKLSTFRRWYTPCEQFLIVPQWMETSIKAYFGKELYKTSYFGHNLSMIQSGFIMTDHFPPIAALPIFKFVQDECNCGHGLLIFQKFEGFVDLFVFMSAPQDGMVNNFYLDRKDLFTTFVKEFYQKMANVLDNLSHYRLIVPCMPQPFKEASKPVLTQQMKCGELLLKGLTTKEIGAQLRLSPRTVEYYIALLKKKTGARNRSHLMHLLEDTFRT
jgi:DNA-binding CsgD family transcriptional regulator